MRLIHAVRDLSAESGDHVETVALFTDEDRSATFVRAADLTYPLGAAATRPYLNHELLECALVETGADAAWVGWGFVAEDPAFAELCERIGVTFVGPSAEAMRKIGSKLIAEEATAGGGGSGISLSLSAANRDPSRYADPGVLDVTRTGNQHLAFGHGVHLCIGQQLARAELRIALRALFTCFPGLRLHGATEDVPLRSESLIYGVRELPITW